MNKYNTFWRRFVAAIIDSLVLWPFSFINGYLDRSSNKVVFTIVNLSFSVIYLAYFVVLHAKYGHTLGKKIMLIKVVDINEISLIDTKRAVMRELPWIVVNIGLFLYLFSTLFLTTNPDLEKDKDSFNTLISATSLIWILIELITMLTNYKKRSVHDYLAKSVVIKIDN